MFCESRQNSDDEDMLQCISFVIFSKVVSVKLAEYTQTDIYKKESVDEVYVFGKTHTMIDISNICLRCAVFSAAMKLLLSFKSSRWYTDEVSFTC